MPRKTIALALSGSGSRAPLYFGMLEVFEEHGIPVDAIAATSSASFIACLYASGTLKDFMTEFFKLNTKQLYQMFQPTFNGGVFSLDKVEELMSPYMAADNLEDLKIPVSILTCDLVKGETVVLSMGNIMRAIKASCSMPGMFEPIIWGDRVLVDGGLFEIVPAEAARAFGTDIVIGVDLSRSLHLMPKPLLKIKKGYNYIRKPVVYLNKAKNAVKEYLFGKKEDEEDEVNINNVKIPNIFSVLGKAVDYAMAERKRGEYVNVDLMITPDASDFPQYRVEDSYSAYLQGRKSAEDALPKIKELLKYS